MREDYLKISAPVFNIQSYSIHDGPGIRVTVFVKGCPLNCLWCANPESNIAAAQLMTYSSKCTGCGQCVNNCPKNAIRIEKKEDTFVAVTDRTLCVSCGLCVNHCSVGGREIVGTIRTVEDVMTRVLKDKLFLIDSGGGITISGGECLMYPEFSEALMYAAKQAGLHTAVESSSFARREIVDRVFKYVDLGLLDIKHMDSVIHKRLTGVPNELILSNIKHIYHTLKVPVTIRIPTIPGYNDSDENIAATAKFTIEQLGSDVHIHLLPYHRMGESKNESLGNTVNMSIEVPSDEHMQHLKSIVESYGIQAQIGG